jgi:DNA-binding transcriptional regulator GbsR (MarR family)
VKNVDSATARARSDRETAVSLVASAIGEVMEFWNFKPSMGRIWAVLYLSNHPLDAEEIEARAGLSAGSVSMTMQDLLHWGVIRRVHQAEGRRRMYEAETDIWTLVARVFRERELRLVVRTVERLGEAARLLEREVPSDAAGMLENRFLLTRVQGLLDLARTGQKMVERLARTGSASLRPLRDVLSTVEGAARGFREAARR